jgi:hypothetical protein
MEDAWCATDLAGPVAKTPAAASTSGRGGWGGVRTDYRVYHTAGLGVSPRARHSRGRAAMGVLAIKS